MARRFASHSIAVLVVLLFVSGAKSFSQDISNWVQPLGMAYWKKHRDLLIAEVRENVFSKLSPPERKIFESVEFVDSDELRFGEMPEAKIVNGRRIIYFPTAYFLQCAAIAQTGYFNSQIPGFELRYAGYCQSALDDFNRTGEIKALKNPFNFSGLNEEEWRKYSADHENRMVESAFLTFGSAFVLAHELAHHVNGDLDHPLTTRDGRLKAEMAADIWACDLLSASGITSYQGACLLDFEFGMLTNAARIPGVMHPPVAERLLNILTHVMENDRDQISRESVAEKVDFRKIDEKWKYEIETIRRYLKDHPLSERY